MGKLLRSKNSDGRRTAYGLIHIVNHYGTTGENGYLKIRIKITGLDANGMVFPMVVSITGSVTFKIVKRLFAMRHWVHVTGSAANCSAVRVLEWHCGHGPYVGMMNLLSGAAIPHIVAVFCCLSVIPVCCPGQACSVADFYIFKPVHKHFVPDGLFAAIKSIAGQPV